MYQILVVDDNEFLRELLQVQLEIAGYIPVIANDASEAIEQLKYNKIDLILLDYMLPGDDGRSFARNIRKDPYFKKIPIIMMSAKDNNADIVESFKVGIDDFMRKPIHFGELISRIERLLRVDLNDKAA